MSAASRERERKRVALVETRRVPGMRCLIAKALTEGVLPSQALLSSPKISTRMLAAMAIASLNKKG